VNARPLHAMPRPCDPTDKSGACPFRVDAEPGEFTHERFEKLADTAGAPGAEVPIGGSWFACHHTRDGGEVACAGWLAVCGVDHIGVRMAVSEGRIAAEALRRPADGPDLFESYDVMAREQSRGVYRPDVADEWRRRAGHGSVVQLDGIVYGVADLGGRAEVCTQRDTLTHADERGSGGGDLSDPGLGEPLDCPLDLTDGPDVETWRDTRSPYRSHWPGGLGG
jgi:hypothetical protein